MEAVKPISLNQAQAAKALGDSLSTGKQRKMTETDGNALSGLDSSAVAERPANTMTGMKTYFIQRIDGGPIKIGKTENEIKLRLAGMQNGSPVTLVCIAYLDGDHEFELHERFHHLGVAGEWFADCDELRDFINRFATPCNIAVPPLTPARRLEKLGPKWARQAEHEHRYRATYRKVTPWRTAQ